MFCYTYWLILIIIIIKPDIYCYIQCGCNSNGSLIARMNIASFIISLILRVCKRNFKIFGRLACYHPQLRISQHAAIDVFRLLHLRDRPSLELTSYYLKPQRLFKIMENTIIYLKKVA